MKLSIITINLNNSSGLLKTIQSTVNQSLESYEYIIIDGGSTDSSVDIIRQFENKISYWLSEPDGGIYNAMNKGIRKATGEYCLFLNSGDYLINESVLAGMVNCIKGEDILYGNGYYVAKGNVLEKLECPEKLTLAFFTIYSLFHPGTLIKRELFEKYGYYNEDNRIVSDWEFFLKTIILNNVVTKLIPLDISIAEDNGISRDPKYSQLLENERAAVLNRYFPGYVLTLMKNYYDLKLENNDLDFRYQRAFNELRIYKKNNFYKAILKIMRILEPSYRTK